MVSLKQARDMYKLQKEAKRMKKELKSIHVEAEHLGVTVTVSGEQKVLSITYTDEVPREKIGEYTTIALNRAMEKAQVVSAERMQGIMGQMGLPTEEGMRGMAA